VKRPRRRLHRGSQAALHDGHAAHLWRIWPRPPPNKRSASPFVLHGRSGSSSASSFIVLTFFGGRPALGLLVDYKVIVLAIDEAHVNRRLQGLLADENNQLKVDDASKHCRLLEGSGQTGADRRSGTAKPSPRCAAPLPSAKSSNRTKGKKPQGQLQEHCLHVPGGCRGLSGPQEGTEAGESRLTLRSRARRWRTMNASEKEGQKLAWLKSPKRAGLTPAASQSTCAVSSEGVDVPALDAVLFLTPRNSQVDVVQSVGRVMRNAPGKKPRLRHLAGRDSRPGMEPHEALNDNKVYKVVWQVLQALRSHDDRFDAMVNKLDLIEPTNVRDTSKMEVIAVTDTHASPSSASRASREGNRATGSPGQRIGAAATNAQPRRRFPAVQQTQIEFEIGEIERAIYAKLVQKVRQPPPLGRMGQRHRQDCPARTSTASPPSWTRPQARTRQSARHLTESFAHELRDDLNDSITDGEVIEMLAQHLITKPVFDAFLPTTASPSQQPHFSKAMQQVLDVLHEHRLNKEADTLERFYEREACGPRASKTHAGKQEDRRGALRQILPQRLPQNDRTLRASCTRRSRWSTSSSTA
jgi:predicted helicase